MVTLNLPKERQYRLSQHSLYQPDVVLLCIRN